MPTRTRRAAILCAAIALAACHKQPQAIKALRGQGDFSRYVLTGVRGQRDGDILAARAAFSDGSDGVFLVDLRLTIDAPAKLQSGKWQWIRSAGFLQTGTVSAESVMFFGGQNGSPSIGGTYDLLGKGGGTLFRVNIPVSLLQQRAPAAPAH